MSPAGLLVAAINTLWQASLLALLVGVTLRLVRLNGSGQALVWGVTFFAACALVPLDLAVQTVTAPRAAVTVAHRAAPGAPRLRPAAPAYGTVMIQAANAAVRPAAHLMSDAVERAALPALVLWGLVSALLLLRVLRAFGHVCALKRRALPMSDPPGPLLTMTRAVRGCRIGISDGIDVPCAVGFLRPMVLLPRALSEAVPSEDAYAMVAHELAHLRRADDLAQLMQKVLLALFFFNPALHAISRRLDFYREAACDERIITSRSSALRYAECLTAIAERTLVRRYATVPALMRGPRQVTARVERLVHWKEGNRRMGRAAILIALAVCATALFFARTEMPLLFGSSSSHTDRETVIVATDGDGDDTLIGALTTAGYHPSVDEVIALTNAGVCSDLVNAVAHSGMERPAFSELIALANAGVDTDLIDAAVKSFGRGISSTDLVRLQESGVDSGDLSEFRSAGDPDLSVADVISLHEAGVDPDYVRHLARLSHDHLSVQDMIRLHEAGVDT